MLEKRAFRLTQIETKDGSEEGVFTGWLSTYGDVDDGLDLVERGAFTKTISEHKGRFPLLFSHDSHSPIGYFDATDKPKGLWIEGVLLKNTIQKAAETYALLKSGVMRGLSIGYSVIKSREEGPVRRLLEVALREGSVCMFPMNREATVESVKDAAGVDFESCLKQIDAALERATRRIGRG